MQIMNQTKIVTTQTITTTDTKIRKEEARQSLFFFLTVSILASNIEIGFWEDIYE